MLEDRLHVQKEVDGFLEEAVVRRELSDNYVFYTPDIYDKLDAASDWAKQTLDDHRNDKREYTYSWYADMETPSVLSLVPEPTYGSF